MITHEFTSAGRYSLSVPQYMRDNGGLIVLAGVGGGGSGAPCWNANVMPGGQPGRWLGAVLQYGSNEIPYGTTALDLVVGAGGKHRYFFWLSGSSGGDTLVMVNGVVILRALGGAGGKGGFLKFGDDGIGRGAGDYMYGGMTFKGGRDVGINHQGDIPGGAGGGANGVTLGGSGADGYLAVMI